jgi:hypothetical protein
MPFPLAPVNGEQTTQNGIVYIYNATLGVWAVLTNTAGNISAGNIVVTNSIASDTVTATGNITGGNLRTSGVTIDASAVTGVSTLSATGTVTVGNVSTAGTVSATGNITGNVIAANVVNTVGNITGGNVTTAGKITATTFEGVFPSGTKMMFVQTAAPTGWTKDTTHDNKALRVVSGTASSGGTVAFTTAFASKAVSGTVGSTTLTTAQIPTHRHPIRGDFRGDSVGVRFGPNDSTNATNMSPDGNPVNTTTYTGVLTAWDTGGSGSHNHSFTGTAIDMAVQYVDTIIATKD